jgi:hypothetical protein
MLARVCLWSMDRHCGGVMTKWVFVLLLSVATVFSQTSGSNYEPGTITAVTPHPTAPGEPDGGVARYDVSVKVGNTVYVVLYTPPNGANGVKYAAGLSTLVLVGSDTLTINNKLSEKTEVPILRRETLPAESALDMSKIPGQYFSMKQQHLSQALELSEDQRIKLKPIMEQEAGEASQFLGSPVVSRKEQVNRWEKLVRASDEKMKPFLSPTQVAKLQQLRQEQKQDLKKIIADANTAKQN